MAKKKKHTLEMTPIMALSIMLLFLMMVPMFVLSNTNRTASTSKAYTNDTQMEASDEELEMENDGEMEPASLREYN